MTNQEYTPALGYDWLTGLYDLAVKLTMPEKRFRSELIDHLDPSSGEHILEFGFGTGANLVVAAKRSPDSSFTGLDIDPKIRELAHRKLQKHRLAIPLELYNGSDFPFESNFFDKVYSCLVFHHLDSETKSHSFQEIFRVLKPGGNLVSMTWLSS